MNKKIIQKPKNKNLEKNGSVLTNVGRGIQNKNSTLLKEPVFLAVTGSFFGGGGFCVGGAREKEDS